MASDDEDIPHPAEASADDDAEADARDPMGDPSVWMGGEVHQTGGDPFWARKPVAESKFRAAGERALFGVDTLVIHDGSGQEIGIRALCDLMLHANRPQNHGSLVACSTVVSSGSRVIYTDHESGPGFWFWDSECGVWVEVSLSVVERYIGKYHGVWYGEINKKTGKRKRCQFEISKVHSARLMGAIEAYRPDPWSHAPFGLQFLDRFLWYRKETQSVEIDAPRPDLRQRLQYPFTMPDPAWMQQLAPDDEEWGRICPPLWHILSGSVFGDKRDWRALQQRLGLALFGMNNLLRGAHIWFVGPKGSGKNTISLSFASVFPRAARTAVPLFDVQEYRTSPLRRSRINVCGEVRKVRTLSFLKDATTDSLLPTRRAGEEETEIEARFLQIFASNESPEVEGGYIEIESLLDRFVLVPFRAFSGPARPNLRAEMDVHARGLVGWALAGFWDWLQTQELEQGSRSGLLKQAWLSRGNPIALWAAGRLVRAVGESIYLQTDAWGDYLRWTALVNLDKKKVGDRNEFISGIRQLGFPTGTKGKHHALSIDGFSFMLPDPIPEKPEKHRSYTP